MQLDIRTLIFNQMLFTLVLAIGLYLVQLNQPRMRGLRWWAAANAICGLGLMLAVLRGAIPDYLSVLIANGVLLIALCCFQTGVERMRGLPPQRWWICPALLAVMQPILAWFTYVEPNVGARVAVVTLVNAVPGFMIVRLLVHRVPPRLRASHWFTAAAFVQYIVFAVVRMADAILYPPESLTSGGLLQALAFLSLFMLLVLSSFGCVWMVTANLADELERQARTDPLTGLLNRLAFDEGFARELQRTRRNGRPLSLLLFDLDYFKQLNDRHGHQAGDDALKRVAEAVQRELRATDLLARYGGEEFLVVLPETGKQCAVETADRLRRAIEALHISCGDGLVLTSSFGVATLPDDGEDAATLVSAADSAMYAAKQLGRNRIVVFTPEAATASKAEPSFT